MTDDNLVFNDSLVASQLSLSTNLGVNWILRRHTTSPSHLLAGHQLVHRVQSQHRGSFRLEAAAAGEEGEPAEDESESGHLEPEEGSLLDNGESFLDCFHIFL